MENKLDGLNKKQLDIINLLNELSTDEERTEILSCFCQHCGTYTSNYNCQCWNDE